MQRVHLMVPAFERNVQQPFGMPAELRRGTSCRGVVWDLGTTAQEPPQAVCGGGGRGAERVNFLGFFLPKT